MDDERIFGITRLKLSQFFQTQRYFFTVALRKDGQGQRVLFITTITPLPAQINASTFLNLSENIQIASFLSQLRSFTIKYVRF